jgi:hypothetical protein
MDRERVNDEQALKLQTLGFNEECMFYLGIKQQIPIPFKQQVFRWFRENYNLLSLVFKDEIHYWFEIERDIYQECISKEFDSYEEAEQACIDKLIEIVKNKTDGKRRNKK